MKTSEFNALSKAEKRVAIAKDALVQMKKGKIVATNCHYLTIDLFNISNSLQKEIKKKDFHCRCCAKGALFVSCVKQVNKVDMTDEWQEESFQKDKLKGYFSALQLDMIETAFEGQVIQDSTRKLEYRNQGMLHETPLGLRCSKFAKYLSAEEGMKKILNNIIKNNGYFRP